MNLIKIAFPILNEIVRAHFVPFKFCVNEKVRKLESINSNAVLSLHICLHGRGSTARFSESYHTLPENLQSFVVLAKICAVVKNSRFDETGKISPFPTKHLSVFSRGILLIWSFQK